MTGSLWRVQVHDGGGAAVFYALTDGPTFFPDIRRAYKALCAARPQAWESIDSVERVESVQVTDDLANRRVADQRKYRVAKTGEASASVLDRCDQCAAWLADQLRDAPQPVHALRLRAEELGYSSKTLYRAKDRLGVSGTTGGGGKKWWHVGPLNFVIG